MTPQSARGGGGGMRHTSHVRSAHCDYVTLSAICSLSLTLNICRDRLNTTPGVCAAVSSPRTVHPRALLPVCVPSHVSCSSVRPQGCEDIRSCVFLFPGCTTRPGAVVRLAGTVSGCTAAGVGGEVDWSRL